MLCCLVQLAFGPLVGSAFLLLPNEVGQIISSTPVADIDTLEHPAVRGALEFFCSVGIFCHSHQARQPSQLQHHDASKNHQHNQSRTHGSTRTIPTSSQLSVKRSATLPEGSSLQVGNLLANLAAHNRKGKVPPSSAGADLGGYLKRTKSSPRRATEAVFLGLEVSPCLHYSHSECLKLR